jgi:glyoxylase-like metal-dependent hydrolase (beta-lactamase superfamily II)
MSDIAQIVLPLPFSQMRTVNAWLLRGDPLTLVDTGLDDDATLAALEDGLREHGVRIEDLELVVATHHHIEHVGLAPEIRRRSGAPIAVLDRMADRCADGERVDRDQRYMNALMAANGAPSAVIASTDGFWEVERNGSQRFDADIRVADGELIRAGGRDLRAVFRPGHSLTDTLLVDDAGAIAFVGDHLLATISSNTEILPAADEERPRARVKYLDGLRRTATMPLERLLTGHGPTIGDHAQLIRTRMASHEQRAARIVAMLRRTPSTVWELACGLWRETTVHRQPVLVTWEVLGHLDVLAAAGAVHECTDADGGASFALTEARAA